MTRCSMPDEAELNHAGADDESEGGGVATKKRCSADKKKTTESSEAALNNLNQDTAQEAAEDGDVAVEGKRKERALIFHLLYAAEGFEYQESLEAIVDNFNRGFEQHITCDGQVFKTAQAIIASREELDAAIKPFLSNWRFERLSVCTRLVLRQAFWELLNTQNPPVVVINEAIELAKCFAETDAYRFVNGVLDSFVKKRSEQE